MLELWMQTPATVIAHICNASTTDHLVGFLSRAGYNDIATDLYLASEKENTA
jgi:hypothetical protein